MNLPTIREELDRKTFETIEWLAVSHDLGKITDGQFNTGVDAVFMSVAGLVNYSIMEIVSAASRSIDRHDLKVRRHFARLGVVVTLEWAAGEGNYRWVTRASNDSILEDKVKTFDTPAMALEKMNKAADRLIGMAFTEL